PALHPLSLHDSLPISEPAPVTAATLLLKLFISTPSPPVLAVLLLCEQRPRRPCLLGREVWHAGPALAGLCAAILAVKYRPAVPAFHPDRIYSWRTNNNRSEEHTSELQ